MPSMSSAVKIVITPGWSRQEPIFVPEFVALEAA